MKKARLFWIAAWSMQTLAWFVRVHHEGVVLPSGLPGWEAWWLSTSTVLHPMASDAPPWYDIILCGVSSLSTVLFLLASPAVFFSKKSSFLRKCAWTALASWFLNSHWVFTLTSALSELRIGYYLWWLSFGVLSAALFAQANEHTTEPTPNAKAVAA
jgi:hypothetical protein